MTDFRTLNGRTLEQAASDLVAREVLCCMSSMVSTLCSGEVASGRDLSGLCEQAADLRAPVLDYEEAAREAGITVIEQDLKDDGPLLYRWSFHEGQDDEAECSMALNSREEAARDACEDLDIEPHELEVYEHWAVSTWLAEKLQAAGERVDTDFAGLCVWARTTTGQAISMDAVVQEITRELHLGNAA